MFNPFWIFVGLVILIVVGSAIHSLIMSRLGYVYVCSKCNADWKAHAEVVDMDTPGCIFCTKCRNNIWIWKKPFHDLGEEWNV